MRSCHCPLACRINRSLCVGPVALFGRVLLGRVLRLLLGGVLLVLIGLIGLATTVQASKLGEIEQVLQKYASAGSVSMKFEKKMYFELLDKKQTQSGRLLMSGGRLRIQSLKPQKMLTVLDDKNLWIEKEAGLVTGKKKQIQVIKLPFVRAGQLKAGPLQALQLKGGASQLGPGNLSQPKLNQLKLGVSSKGAASPVQQFLKDKSMWKKIKLVPSLGGTQAAEGERVYGIDTSQVPQLRGWSQLRVHIQVATKFITRVFFKNKLGNTTEYVLSEIKASPKKQSITYKPPRGAEIIEN